MLTFAMCSIPGWVVMFGLWIGGIDLWFEWGVLAVVLFGLAGSLYAEVRR